MGLSTHCDLCFAHYRFVAIWGTIHLEYRSQTNYSNERIKKYADDQSRTGYFFSCKKGDTGPQGATGEKGEQGEQGEKGVQGVKGGDGATIFSGDVVPSASIGKAGDYYIRKTTSEMYGLNRCRMGQSDVLQGSDRS